MFIYYVYFASFNQKLAFIGYFDVIKPKTSHAILYPATRAAMPRRRLRAV